MAATFEPLFPKNLYYKCQVGSTKPNKQKVYKASLHIFTVFFPILVSRFPITHATKNTANIAAETARGLRYCAAHGKSYVMMSSASLISSTILSAVSVRVGRPTVSIKVLCREVVFSTRETDVAKLTFLCEN